MVALGAGTVALDVGTVALDVGTVALDVGTVALGAGAVIEGPGAVSLGMDEVTVESGVGSPDDPTDVSPVSSPAQATISVRQIENGAPFVRCENG
jgi:hypothetical protein